MGEAPEVFQGKLNQGSHPCHPPLWRRTHQRRGH